MPEPTEQPTRSFLLLYQQDLTKGEVESEVEGVEAALREQFPLNPKTTLVIPWYQDRFPGSGDWDAWVWDTVSGRDYATRQPFFHAFVICTPRLGRAGGAIATLALRMKKPVLSWVGGTLGQVSDVVREDVEDIASGWGYCSTPFGDPDAA